MTTELTPDDWQRACRLFDDALEHASAVRADWLQAHCSDPALRELVWSMLQADAVASAEPEPAPLRFADWLDQGWPTGLTLGPYQIERRIGSGGMGEVYLARRSDGAVTQQVAIKRLRSSLNRAELERRFLAERRILAQLAHPHIARFLDAGSDDQGQPYAVIEYVDGVAITEYVEQEQLGTDARLRLFLQIADAVDHAHRQLIVHRDIKPGNVLVDRGGSPHLLDFGIAKVLDPESTAVGSGERTDDTAFEHRVFSLSHAAPEQLRGEVVGVACDVYALGVLLYQLLTGQLPLPTAGLAYGQAERLILSCPPAPPSSVAGRELRGDLDRIILHALKKDVADRYPSVQALRADLQRHLDRKPISLRRHHRWYRWRLLLRRHPWPIGLGAGLLATIVLGSALIYRQSVIATEQRDQARAAMGLLQSAFRASNPLQISDADITLGQFLAAARPELEQRLDRQPRLYAELAGTLADVELAIGRATNASELAERAWQAWQRHPDDAALGKALTLLRARAALAAGDYASVEERLHAAAEAGDALHLDWALVRGRLLSHRGDHAAAAALLQDLLVQYAHLDASDERAGELRRLAAQAQRFLGHDAAALDLIDQTIAWQQRSLPEQHPRLILSRLYRIGPLGAVAGTEAALVESERLLPIVKEAFGADSTVTAAAQSALASTLNEVDRRAEAAVAYEQALATWRRAAGEHHQNSLRTAFNLAQMRAAIDPSDPRIEPLYADVVAQGERSLGADRHTVLFWRLGWIEYLLGRGDLERAQKLIDERAELLLEPSRRAFLDRYLEGAAVAEASYCAANQASPQCLNFLPRLAELRAASSQAGQSGD